MGANTYPIEEWVITEEKFLKEWNYRNETTFALSNGYIGTRGTFDEGYPFTVDEGLEGNLTDFTRANILCMANGISDFLKKVSHY